MKDLNGNEGHRLNVGHWHFCALAAALLTTLVSLPVHGAVIVTNIANFGMAAAPSGDMIQATDGYWYGPQLIAVGVHGGGGIFRMSASGSYTEYPADATNDAPDFLIEGKDGNFYGLSSYGVNPYPNHDLANYGSVFQFLTNGTFTALATFAGTNGSTPVSLVQTDDGNFYGVTMYGGVGFTSNSLSGYGTIFRIDTNGTFTTLYYFTGSTNDGAYPYRLAAGSDGNVYGATEAGGADTNATLTSQTGIYPSYGFGTAFVVHPDGTVALKASFTLSNNVGAEVTYLARGSDGNVYGTTGSGGLYGKGTIFEFCTNGTLSPVAAFDGTNGAFPQSVLQASDGGFYGVSVGNGETPYPNVYRWSPAGGIVPLYSFTFGTPWGPYPLLGLAQGTNGLFYGQGAGQNQGFIFQISLPVAPVVQPAISAGALNLTWNAVPGQTYQVQYTSDATQTNWTNFGSPITATNGTLSLPDSTGTAQQRFYRVVIAP